MSTTYSPFEGIVEQSETSIQSNTLLGSMHARGVLTRHNYPSKLSCTLSVNYLPIIDVWLANIRCLPIINDLHYWTRKLSDRQNVFLSSFFFFFKRASSNLHDSFTMVSHKTAAFFTEQCTSPSLFYRFEVSQGSSNRSLKSYGSHVHMHTNHLATKCDYYYARLLN